MLVRIRIQMVNTDTWSSIHLELNGTKRWKKRMLIIITLHLYFIFWKASIECIMYVKMGCVMPRILPIQLLYARFNFISSHLFINDPRSMCLQRLDEIAETVLLFHWNDKTVTKWNTELETQRKSGKQKKQNKKRADARIHTTCAGTQIRLRKETYEQQQWIE